MRQVLVSIQSWPSSGPSVWELPTRAFELVFHSVAQGVPIRQLHEEITSFLSDFADNVFLHGYGVSRDDLPRYVELINKQRDGFYSLAPPPSGLPVAV